MRLVLLQANRIGYAGLLRPLIFRRSAGEAHTLMIRLVGWLDRQPALCRLLAALRRVMLPDAPVDAGGVVLAGPLILAAGLVKGDGFLHEDSALTAVQRGRNIMPGWRAIPAMTGLVEFGSFTRWPRMGNPGTVMWRDAVTGSTQNRVGLKNPGVRAAAAFLSARQHSLPPQFGINIAVSPGVTDPDQQVQEVLEGLRAFVEAGVIPTWFTLNLSCPNTEDDPGGHQTADLAEQLCGAAVAYLQREGRDTPLWVKVSPGLADEQYAALMAAFARVGVRAVIATNTLAMPTPDDPTLAAGVGGGLLHDPALAATRALRVAGGPVTVIGCGGVQDGATFDAFAAAGAPVAQYWSALVYRGPFAAALIQAESQYPR